MANEVMAKAMTGIDDELIVNAYKASRKKRNRRPLYTIGSLAACLVLVFTMVFASNSKSPSVYVGSDKITSEPYILSYETLSSTQRSASQDINLSFRLNLKGETRLTCSQGNINLCGANQDTLFYSGNSFLAEKDVAKKELSLYWTLESPEKTQVYTLTFEGKETQVLTLSFDEDTQNWSVFIEK